MTDKELFLKAEEQLSKAYAPYSGFQVGAALLCKDGSVFTGVNVENASYGATICAERTAMVKAVSEGNREFSAIAIVSCQGTAWPCGICRQFMSEFSKDMRIITGDDEDHLKTYTISEMLLEAFELEK